MVYLFYVLDWVSKTHSLDEACAGCKVELIL